MHPDYDYEYDSILHETAERLAHSSLDENLPHVTFCSEVLARAYLDLRERRGMPPTLRMEPTIQLQSGAWFDFLNPLSTPISPEDIAAGLAKQSRYTGHTVGYRPYSIAQHCCHASDVAPRKYAFEALMHDAPESVLGDIATPLKQLLPDYKVIEERITVTFAKWFGFPSHMRPDVKVIDIRMAATEKRDIMPGNEEWEMLRGITPYDLHIKPWDSERAFTEWLTRFYTLFPTDARFEEGPNSNE